MLSPWRSGSQHRNLKDHKYSIQYILLKSYKCDSMLKKSLKTGVNSHKFLLVITGGNETFAFIIKLNHDTVIQNTLSQCPKPHQPPPLCERLNLKVHSIP